MTSNNPLNGGQVIIDYLIKAKVPYVFGHGSSLAVPQTPQRGTSRCQWRSRPQHQNRTFASPD
jgi:hypothetical protein